MGDDNGDDNNNNNDNQNGNNNDNNNNNSDYWTCCNDDQTLFILMYVTFFIVAFITYNTIIAKPIRLMTTFVHEMCHATTCWITGGEVIKIQVFTNEGGVTTYRGGCRLLIIPAGYIGTSVWSMILIIVSGGRKTTTVTAIVFLLSLLLSLCYSPNRTMIYCNIIFSIVLVLLLYVEWFIAFTNESIPPLLQLVILFLGVYIGLLSIRTIYTDTVRRAIEGSDAYACYEEVYKKIICCKPQCIGIQWLLVAIVLQIFGCIIAIIQMSNECQNISWLSCISLLQTRNDNNNNNNNNNQFTNWQEHYFHNGFNFDGFFNNGP